MAPRPFVVLLLAFVAAALVFSPTGGGAKRPSSSPQTPRRHRPPLPSAPHFPEQIPAIRLLIDLNLLLELPPESAELEDYPPFDPVPGSKAAVIAGPIEHGTPLMPYVPRPPPPPLPPPSALSGRGGAP